MATNSKKPKVVVMREESEEIQHFACRSDRIESIKDYFHSSVQGDASHVYLVGTTRPLPIQHNARDLAMQVFGSARSYRTRRATHSERMFINEDLVSHIQFLKSGSEPKNASKGMRSITIKMVSGRAFSVVENAEVVMKGIFHGAEFNFAMPKNYKLKSTVEEYVE